MIKKVFISLLVFIFIYCMYKPLVIELNSSESFTALNLKKGLVFKLKDFIKLDKAKKSKVYLVLNSEEMDNLTPEVPKWDVLISEDENVINNLLNFELNYTGGDVSTIQSKIYIYSGNKLLLESEILLDRNSIGLQNRELGWVTPVNRKALIDVFGQFKRYNYPLLIIY